MTIHIVNENDVPLQKTDPGHTKFLYESKNGAGPNIMIRFFSSTVLDVHAHPFNEMFYVLEGELQVGEIRYPPGSCIFISKDTPYGPIHAPNGAKVLRYAEGSGRTEVAR